MRINQRNLKSPLPSGQEVLIRHSAFRIPHSAFRIHRPGFTLVELIVVIAIIAILAALTTGAVMRYYGVQQQTNTETVIRKVYGAFERQWQAVIDQANREPLPPPSTSPDYAAYNFVLNNIAGGDASRARVIWVKLRLKQEFPMSFDEVLNVSGSSPFVLSPIAEYQSALLPLVASSAKPPPPYPPNKYQWYTWDQQNSALLLLALTRSRGGFSISPDDLGPDATADLIPPPPSAAPNQLPPNLLPTLRIIVDGWKKPVVFFRWAASNTELDTLNPATTGSQFMFRDPQDPTGMLMNPAWWSSSTPNYRSTFEGFLHPIHTIWSPANSQPPTDGRPYLPSNGVPYPPFMGPYPATPTPYFVIGYEYYMVPVVASSGSNKAFGIVPPPDLASAPWNANQIVQLAAWYGMQPDGTGDDSDNIYSYRLRLGARGD
jgi:prepilin-type N-terminal cleavage/methylation domain-containing protein